MDFGIFSTIDVRPERGQTEATSTENYLTQCEYAEELGYDSVWFAEQRFFPEYACSPAPELLAAALARRTERVRMGFAVILAPYHHPIHTAGKFATLDILTRGRVEFGVGRGAQTLEGDVLGTRLEESREIIAEHLDVLRKAWTQEGFTHEGVHYPIKQPISIVPKPLQRPHPPIWAAALQADSADVAGEMGHGLMLASHYSTFEEVQEFAERYRASFARAGHRHAPRIAVLTEVYVDTDMDKARAVAGECFVWNGKYTGKILANLGHKPIKSYEAYYELVQAGGIPDERMTFEALQEVKSIIVGDPAYCTEAIKAYAELGVDLFIGWTQSGGMPHAKVMGSMKLFSEKVMPALR